MSLVLNSLDPWKITTGKLRFSERKEDEYEDKRQTGLGLIFYAKNIIKERKTIVY